VGGRVGGNVGGDVGGEVGGAVTTGRAVVGGVVGGSVVVVRNVVGTVLVPPDSTGFVLAVVVVVGSGVRVTALFFLAGAVATAKAIMTTTPPRVTRNHRRR
jgi:hypothetical protein